MVNVRLVGTAEDEGVYKAGEASWQGVVVHEEEAIHWRTKSASAQPLHA